MKSNEESGADKNGLLRTDGTLNPSPEKVLDSKFREHDFFDPYDLVQVRYEMLRRVSVENVSVTDVAQEFGISRPTYYQAKTSLETEGLAGLVPKKRGPHGPHKLRPEIIAFLRQQLLPGQPIRARELAKLVRERFGLRVHPRTIERVVQEKKHFNESKRGKRLALRHDQGLRSLRTITRNRLRGIASGGRSERIIAVSAFRNVALGMRCSCFDH